MLNSSMAYTHFNEVFKEYERGMLINLEASQYLIQFANSDNCMEIASGLSGDLEKVFWREVHLYPVGEKFWENLNENSFYPIKGFASVPQKLSQSHPFVIGVLALQAFAAGNIDEHI